MYITRLTPKEIFSPSNKIHREVGRAKDLSAPPVYSNYVEAGILFHCHVHQIPAVGRSKFHPSRIFAPL